MSPHSDAETAFGSGKTSLAPHADSDNCKHIDASQENACPICSSFAARALPSSSTLALEPVIQITVVPRITLSSVYSFFLLTSFSRRGPPFPLA
jgi:hypothetical protein